MRTASREQFRALLKRASLGDWIVQVWLPLKCWAIEPTGPCYLLSHLAGNERLR